MKFNHKEIWERYSFEIKDCLVYGLNLLFHLCNEPPMDLNNTKETRRRSSSDNLDIRLKTNEITVIIILYISNY